MCTKAAEYLDGKLNGLYIELTSKCNLACTYCYNDSGKTGKEFFSAPVLFHVLNDAKERQGANNLILSGGEPFLHPSIVDICSFAYKLGFSISIYTNGTLLTKEIIKKLTPYAPRFQITLDSYQQGVNDTYKGEGAYLGIIRGINLLQAFYNMEQVSIRCNVTHGFLNSDNVLEEYLTLMVRLGVKNCYFSTIKNTGRAEKGCYPTKTNHMIELQKLRLIAAKLTDQKFGHIHVDVPIGVCQACPYTMIETYNGKYMLHITPSGDVFPCSELASSKYILGNVYSETLSKIFLGQAMNEFVQSACKRNIEYVDCKLCSFRFFCGKGCLGEEPDNSVADGQCSYRKKEMASLLRARVNGW